MPINYKRIGERIQTARKLKGLSIGDLAAEVHFTPQSIVFAENGEATMNLDFVLPLCSVLGISPNDLLEGEYLAVSGGSFEERSTLDELRKLMMELRGEEENDSDATVFKDAETAVAEIKKMLTEYKEKGKKEAKLSQKKTTHW